MKILFICKDFLGKDGVFGEKDAKTLKEYGHQVMTSVDVPSAQRSLNNGYHPDLVFIDNALEGAQLFSKQLAVMDSERKIWVMVDDKATASGDPARIAVTGFILGAITLEKALEIAGDERLPAPAPTPVALDGFIVQALNEPVIEVNTRRSQYTVVEDKDDKPVRININIPIFWRRRKTREKQEEPTVVAPPVMEVSDVEVVPSQHNNTIDLVARITAEPNKEKAEREEQSRWFTSFKYRVAFPVTLGLMAAGLMANYILAKPVSINVRPVVPSYCGMNAEEANAVAAKSGLPCEIIEVRSSDGTGLVISQEPPAGTLNEDTEKLQLMLSVKATDGDIATTAEAGPGPAAQGGESGGEAPTTASTPAPPAAHPATTAQTPAKSASSRPTVSVSASRTSGPSSGFMVTLNASASDPGGGSIVSYSWSCGGSGPRTSCEMVSNVAPAARSITCTVTNDKGQTASASVTITMN